MNVNALKSLRWRDSKIRDLGDHCAVDAMVLEFWVF